MKPMAMSEIDEQYKALLKRYKLSDAQIGRMFGYASAPSWYASSRRLKVIAGIVELEKLLKLQLTSV